MGQQGTASNVVGSNDPKLSLERMSEADLRHALQWAAGRPAWERFCDTCSVTKAKRLMPELLDADVERFEAIRKALFPIWEKRLDDNAPERPHKPPVKKVFENRAFLHVICILVLWSNPRAAYGLTSKSNASKTAERGQQERLLRKRDDLSDLRHFSTTPDEIHKHALGAADLKGRKQVQDLSLIHI